MGIYGLLLGILGVWRVTHLLNAEDGPFDVLVHLRQAAGQGPWARLLDCFYCLSLWVAAPFAYIIGGSWRERLLLWLALSGGAALLHGVISKSDGGQSATYWEGGEVQDGMLREEPEQSQGCVKTSEPTATED